MRGRAALLCLALLACQRPAPVVPTGTLPPLPPPPPDQIVATVNGHPITVTDVATQARAAGTSAKDALDALVRAELLAQAAETAGLAADPAVQVAARRETVRRYLSGAFETEVTPQTAVSEDRLRKLYERNKSRLVHPDVRVVQQILVSNGSAEDARVVADEVRRLAGANTSAEAFAALVDKVKPLAAEKKVKVQLQVGPTARYGTTVEPFAKATFDLKKLGDVSPVVTSPFGLHVIRYNELIAEENISFEEAKEKLREGAWPDAQVRAFAEYQDRVGREHAAKSYPERLAALQEAEQGKP